MSPSALSGVLEVLCIAMILPIILLGRHWAGRIRRRGWRIGFCVVGFIVLGVAVGLSFSLLENIVPRECDGPCQETSDTIGWVTLGIVGLLLVVAIASPRLSGRRRWSGRNRR